jgi:hypothetical protein
LKIENNKTFKYIIKLLIMSKQVISSSCDGESYVSSSDNKSNFQVGVATKDPVSFDANIGLANPSNPTPTGSVSSKIDLTENTSVMLGVGRSLTDSRTSTFTSEINHKLTPDTSVSVNHTHIPAGNIHSTTASVSKSIYNNSGSASAHVSRNNRSTFIGIGFGFKF